MAKKRSELHTTYFRKGDDKYPRDEFDNPEFRRAVSRTRREGGIGPGVAGAMEAERAADVARARRRGLSDLTALQDRDLLASMRKPGAKYADQPEDVRRYDLRSKLTRTAGIGGRAEGGKVKKMAKGGSTASKRGDGCATKGKTKGRFV